jgi:hypothetical protein
MVVAGGGERRFCGPLLCEVAKENAPASGRHRRQGFAADAWKWMDAAIIPCWKKLWRQ